MKRIVLCFVAFLLFAVCLGDVQAESISVKSENFRGKVSVLSYPVLQGHRDAAVEERINTEIAKAIQLDDYRLLASSEKADATPFEMSFRAYLLPESDPQILSICVSIEGKLLNQRLGHQRIPLMYNLKDGTPIQKEGLFSDPKSAQEHFDAFVQKTYQEGDMTYLDADQAVPVPMNTLYLTDHTLNICYDQNTFRFLSDRSAELSFYAEEILTLLKDEADSVPQKCWPHLAENNESTQAQFRSALKEGRLPGVPAVMLQRIEELYRSYKKAEDSSAYMNGREAHRLEDAQFRDMMLITDEGSETVHAVLSYRMGLFGCATGKTDRQACLARLGQPLATLDVDRTMADLYQIPMGKADVYTENGFSLMLCTDEQGMFRAVYLYKD